MLPVVVTPPKSAEAAPQDDPNVILYGPEFTFAKAGGEMASVVDPDRLVGRMHDHLVNGQTEAERFVRSRNQLGNLTNKFTSPNGWQVTVKRDNGVVEVNVSPLSLADYERYGADIHDAIFASAFNVELYPAMFMGGGHISVSLAPLLAKPLLLRNFIVDFLNHNEIGLGVWNYDNRNAVSQSLFNEDEKLKIKAVLAAFDEDLQMPGGQSDIARAKVLLKDLHKVFFDGGTDYHGSWCGKMTAVSLIRCDETGGRARIEIRSVRPQASVDMFVRQIRLIEKRIRYLEKIDHPVPFAPIVPILPGANLTTHALIPPVDPQLALQAFYQYVAEAGEEWRQHTDYVWPAWVTTGELAKFEESQWFKDQEAHQLCSRALGG